MRAPGVFASAFATNDLLHGFGASPHATGGTISAAPIFIVGLPADMAS